MSLKRGFFSAAYSEVMIRCYEYGDAAVSAGANACGHLIARDVYLVKDRISRNRMGACGRRRGIVVNNGIPMLVIDAEDRTGLGYIEVVITAGEEIMIVAGIVPNFVVAVQTG